MYAVYLNNKKMEWMNTEQREREKITLKNLIKYYISGSKWGCISILGA